MKTFLYPLTFHPQFRHYIWGGRNLETLGRILPSGAVAESWDISGHPASPTIVDAGPREGVPLTTLVRDWGLDLLGACNEEALRRGQFPLLVKLLDACHELSVQVHPSDAYSRLHENGEWGKTEMWYVLRAEPAARIVLGLRRGTTRPRFERALQEGRVEEYLHYAPVKAGDAILLEAGSLHALLGGIILVEIQQTSDITYRIYDWNRVGADGQPRPLHVERALEAINFRLIEPTAFVPQVVRESDGVRQEIISETGAFTVERVTLAPGASFAGACRGDTFEIWGCVTGTSGVIWERGRLRLPAVRFALFPAALGEFTVEAHEPAVLLRAWAGRQQRG